MKCLCSILIIVLSLPCYACGPWYPYSFIESDGENCYPKIVFREELTLMAKKYIKDLDKYPLFIDPKISSQKADEMDFMECLESLESQGLVTETEKKKIFRRYIDYSVLCRKGKESSFEYPDRLKRHFQEFELYLEGVKDLQSNATFRPWYDLLKLPENQRKYRTTWALYMLGNFVRQNPEKSHDYYEKVRQAVMKGFKDSQGLAYGTFKRDFLVENLEDPEKRFYYGLRAWKYYSSYKDPEKTYAHFIYKSMLDEAHLSNHKKNLKKKLKAQLTREVLAARALSSSWAYDGYAEKLLTELKGLEINQGDKLAFLAYSKGNIELTKKWLELTPQDSFLGRWLRAELARREGKYDKAAEHYRIWLKSFREAKRKGRLERMENVYFDPDYSNLSFHKNVYAQLGTTSIHRRDFLEAMHCFMMAGSWVDVAYIADYILSLEEVETYYLQFKDKPDFFCSTEKEKKAFRKNEDYQVGMLYYYKTDDLLSNLENLLARRFMREKKYKKALAYFSGETKKTANEYLEYLEKSKDKKIDMNIRALALYNAAKFMRYNGMELTGAEGYPDSHYFGGDYNTGVMRNEDMPIDLQCKREEYDTPKPFRYHYRHIAADMMMKAAEMSTDKNLKIMAYYIGGRWLAHRHPYVADPFYKKLVRLRHTAFSDDADDLRWFPKYCSELINNEYDNCEPVKSLAVMKEIVDSYSEIVVYE